MLVLDQVKEPLVATDEEAVIAKEAAEKLRSAAIAGVDVWLGVAEKADVVVPLPARAVEMIVAVLTAIAERRPISLIPHTAESDGATGGGFSQRVAAASGGPARKEQNSVSEGWQPLSRPCG